MRMTALAMGLPGHPAAAAILVAAAVVGHGSYVDRDLSAVVLMLTLAGFAVEAIATRTARLALTGAERERRPA
jgi:hypothetical protein